MWNSFQASLLRLLVRWFPAPPHTLSIEGPAIFRDECFTGASEERQRDILLESAQYRYDYESEIGFFDTTFPWVQAEELRGKTFLDLGGFTGGRVVAWKERYDLGDAYGINIEPVFARAGQLLAEQKGLSITFKTGFAERLPFDDNCFDFIVASDVFEHVKDVKQAMSECYRTLKQGGRLLTSFPGFYQPLESHLGQLTTFLGAQCLFSPEVIRTVFSEVRKAKDPEGKWRSSELEDWEVTPSLNGITMRKFRHIIGKHNWSLRRRACRPILSSGKRAKRLFFRALRAPFVIPARLPFLEEVFLDRIAVDLEKRDPPGVG